MLQAILLVLKIIGMIVLVLLAILLIACFGIMFVPVRYKLKAAKTDVIMGEIRISWLLKIISIKLYYREHFNAILKIFGIPVYDNSKSEEKAKKKAERTKKKEEKAKEKAEKAKKKEEKAKEKADKAKEKEEKADNAQKSNPKRVTSLSKETLDKKETTVTAESKCEEKTAIPPPFEEKEISLKEIEKAHKKKSLWEKLQDIFKKIRSAIEHIYDTIVNILNRLQYYLKLWEREEVKKSFALCKKQLLKIGNHIKPQKFKLFLRIGFDDPAVTGQILAYYSMLYPVFGNTVKIQPEFEETIVEGNLYAKGRITAFTFMRVAWTIYFNKDVRKFLELLKKEEL